MDIARLVQAIDTAVNEGGAYGQNLHPSKDVKIKIGQAFFDVERVAVAFLEGSFVLVLDAQR